MLDLAEDHHHVPTILGHLADEMAAAVSLVRRHDRVLPGVAELLGLLDADGRFVQTVLTGNIAPNALVKLAAFDLDRFVDLEIGAYGSDRTDRNELVPVALARAAEHRGLDFGADEVWVIGDSANDLACARAAGVRCLLVATGRLGAAELEALGPDAWRPDLADVADVAGLLAG
jgi:phosphoglycolate phosphatase-like HAD superfamily hydrolase